MGKKSDLNFSDAATQDVAAPSIYNNECYAGQWVQEMAKVREHSGVCKPVDSDDYQNLAQDFEGVKAIVANPQSTAEDVHHALKDIAVDKPQIAGTVALVGHMFFTNACDQADTGTFDYAVSQGMHMLGQVEMARSFAAAAPGNTAEKELENPAIALSQPGLS